MGTTARICYGISVFPSKIFCGGDVVYSSREAAYQSSPRAGFFEERGLRAVNQGINQYSEQPD